ncbi:hypothetical protein CHARACLAT_021941 [Characodon lateralis]|uniref:Uncharacterized protein n=1 Tax=Characodon lateralis TaxID=208331 RepID=A0ABU7CT94_9TELE|nr:hypothetical protein [Characodon lateralis]
MLLQLLSNTASGLHETAQQSELRFWQQQREVVDVRWQHRLCKLSALMLRVMCCSAGVLSHNQSGAEMSFQSLFPGQSFHCGSSTQNLPGCCRSIGAQQENSQFSLLSESVLLQLASSLAPPPPNSNQ